MYKVLIVGAGNIGSDYDNPESKYFLTHAHAFTKHSGFELIGFVDNDPVKAQNASMKWSTRYFMNLNEAFKEYPAIDVVCIAVPDRLHYEILKEVANFQPKLVFAEKPLTETLDQALEIQKLYHELNIPVLINFKRAFVPEIIDIIGRASQNEFGTFVSCSGLYNRGFKHNASHLLDLISRFTECKQLNLLSVIDYISDFSVDDPSYSIVARTEKDASVIIKSFSGGAYPIFELDLHFSYARIRLFNTGENLEISRVQPSSAFSGFQILKPLVCIDTSLNQSMAYAVENIYQYFTKAKKLTVPITDGIQVMLLTNQILKEINNIVCQN
jgi:hypothetical protein